MKKLLKILLIFVALLLAVAVGGAVYVLNSSSFQTNMANRILASKFEGAKIEKLSAGLGGFTVTDIVFPLPTGDRFTADSLSAEYALSDLLKDKINIKNVDLKNGKLKLADRSKLPEAEKPAKESSDIPAKTQTPEGAAGKAETLAQKPEKTEFKWDIVLDLAKAEIEVEAPNGSSVKVNAELSQLSVKNLLPQTAALKAGVTATAKGLDPETFDIDATLLPEGDKVSLKIAVRHKAKNLLLVSAKLSPDFKNADAEAQLEIDDKQIESLAAGFGIEKLPVFNSAIYVNAKISDSAEKAEAKMIFKNTASELKNINAALEALGGCGLSGEIDLSKNGGVISFAKIEILVSESGRNIISANSAAPFSIDINDLSKLPEGDLALATISIPSGIVAAFVPSVKFEADDIRTKLSVGRGADNSIKVATVSPLTLSNANISKDGRPIVRNFTALIDASVDSDINGNAVANAKLRIAESAERELTLEGALKTKDGAINAEISAEGSLNALLSRIAAVSAYPVPQNLTLTAGTNVSFKDSVVSVEKTSALLNNGETRLLSLQGGEKLSYNLNTKKLSAASEKILSAEAENVPYAIIKPFTPDIDAESVSFKGDILLTDQNAEIFAIPFSASAKAISFKKNNEVLVRDISPSADAKIVFNKSKMTLNAALEKATISDGMSNFAAAEADAKYDISAKKLEGASFKGTVQLPPLLNQPALLKFSNLSTGSLDVSGKADAGSLGAKMELHNISARTKQGDIGKLAAEISAKFNENFSDIKADVSVKANSTRGETSASANIRHAADTRVSVNAESVVADDLLLLAAAFSNPNYEAAKAAAATSADPSLKKIVRPKEADMSASSKPEAKADSFAKKDAKAFWYAGRAIYVDAKIGKLVKDGKILIQNANASMLCEENMLSLSSMNAIVADADLKAAANISFDSSAAVPYRLYNTNAELNGFSVEKVFADSENAMISGVFNATAQIDGSGNNAEHLLSFMTGSAKVKGNGGVLRLVSKNSTIGTVGTALQIAGAFLGNRANEVGAIGDIIDAFKQLKYGEANIVFTRKQPDYNFNIETAEFKSDEILLSASGGKILFNPDIDFKEQSLNIPVSMQVREGSGMQTMLKKIGMAKTKSETSGFAQGPNFTITGTVAKPSSSLAEILSGAKTTNSTGSEGASGASILKGLFK